jgi:hypothetical protein
VHESQLSIQGSQLFSSSLYSPVAQGTQIAPTLIDVESHVVQADASGHIAQLAIQLVHKCLAGTESRKNPFVVGHGHNPADKLKFVEQPVQFVPFVHYEHPWGHSEQT